MGRFLIPRSIQKQAHEAILALEQGRGLEPPFLQTIQLCIRVCPEAFHEAYEAFFNDRRHGRKVGELSLQGNAPTRDRQNSLLCGEQCSTSEAAYSVPSP